MYITNRKNGFRIVRELANGSLVIASRYRTQTKVTPEQLAAGGYRKTPNPPAPYLRG